MRHALLAFAFLSVVAPTPSALAQDRESLITEARVTEIVSFLASDDMAGRDTPSRGQNAAAEFLAASFEAAGLQPVNGSYFHEYELPGQVLDSTAVKVTLFLKGQSEGVELEGDRDVRIYRPASAAFDVQDSPVTVSAADSASGGRGRGRRRGAGGAGPGPVSLIKVDPESSALWKVAAGQREVLGGGGGRGGRGGRRGRGGATQVRPPTLLVREGALPEGEIDRAHISVPAPKAVSVKLRNVVAVLPGTDKKDEFVLFSAHYDHVGVGLPRDGDGIFNGADDNASGTTSVLTLAEAYAKSGVAHRRSFMFVGFSGEEKGLRGAREFAEAPSVPLEQIAVNLNIEMVGRPLPGKRNAAWVTGKQYSDFESIVEIGFERAGIELMDFERASGLFNSSDNAALASKGVVAHSISAGSLHEDYHQVSDHVDKLDLPHMTNVIRGIYEAGLEFANREARPAYNAVGREYLDLDR